MLEREDVTPEARARELALMRGEPAGLASLAGARSARGRARGPLVGGNLKLLLASLGTPWEIDTRGAILFLEEVSEAPYAIDRSLVHLREAGKLEGVRGIAVGQLVRCESERYPGASAGEAVREILGSAVDGPIVVDLPFGHVADHRALGFGVLARLDGARGELELLEPVVEVDRVKLAEVNRRLGKVERAIERAIERGELPGAVVLARMGDELRYERALRRRDARARAPRGAREHDLRPGVAHQGDGDDRRGDAARRRRQLALDAPVATWLPAFEEHGKDKISVRHLLTHSSGLRPWRAYHADLRERDRRRRRAAGRHRRREGARS